MRNCPRLNKLTFMMCDMNNSSNVPRGHPLTLISHSLRNLRSTGIPAEKWPVGFQALKEVAVGAFSGIEYLENHYSTTSRSVAPLFLLPQLEILHFALDSDSIVETGCTERSEDELEEHECDEYPESQSIFSNFGIEIDTTDVSSSDVLPSNDSDSDSDTYRFEWGQKISSVRVTRCDVICIHPVKVRSFIRAWKVSVSTSATNMLRRNSNRLTYIRSIIGAHGNPGSPELFSHPWHTVRVRAIDNRVAQLRSLLVSKFHLVILLTMENEV